MPIARFSGRVLVSLLGAAIVTVSLCHALALHAESSEISQNPTTPVSFASPELDALAANMAQEIVKRKVGVVVVVGSGPTNKVTELGAGMHDAFNDSLARQTQGAHVLEGAGVRDMLRKSRVSEEMLYKDVIAAWIAHHSSADACVTFRISDLTGNHAKLEAQLFTKDKKGFQSNYRISIGVTLTDAQVALADSDYHSTPYVPGVADAKSVPVMPKCLYCPSPFSIEEERRLKISGTVYLDVIVRTDGLADNILVLKQLGNGLDAAAIDTILKWKFEPAKDAQRHAIPAHVPIEIPFQLR